jgi:nicotinamidase-related amidase
VRASFMEATARQAYERGFNVVLAVDVMTGTCPGSHVYSLSHVFLVSENPLRHKKLSIC